MVEFGREKQVERGGRLVHPPPLSP
jgi:hypothetical protein